MSSKKLDRIMKNIEDRIRAVIGSPPESQCPKCKSKATEVIATQEVKEFIDDSIRERTRPDYDPANPKICKFPGRRSFHVNPCGCDISDLV